MRHIRRQTLQMQSLGTRTRLGHLAQPPRRLIEPRLAARHTLRKPRRHRRRGLKRRMCHHVGHTRILVVTDTRNDGQRELRHIGAETVRIETTQIACRAAAADQNHGIELLRPFGHGTQRRHDRILGRGTLHHGVEQSHDKGIATPAQFVAEVAVSCRRRTRHNGYALHQQRHRRLAVHVPHAVGLQSQNRLPTLALHLPERIGGIQIDDLQRQPVEFVVRDQHPHQNLHPRLQTAARLGLEVG